MAQPPLKKGAVDSTDLGGSPPPFDDRVVVTNAVGELPPVDGRNVVNLDADGLAFGTVPVARLTGTYSIDISGDADTLDGQEGSYYQNAGNLNAGTLLDARLPNTGVIAGSYTNADITIDAKGRITAASDGLAGGLGGGGQEWETFTVPAQRDEGNTYSNTTGQPLAAFVIANANTSSNNVFEVRESGSPPGTWIKIDDYDIASSGANDRNSLQGIVPDGWDYRVRQVAGSNYSITVWAELR